jgi:hypothetical protein
MPVVIQKYIARVANGTILEIVPGDGVPIHKLAYMKPVVGEHPEYPTYDANVHVIEGPNYAITGNTVTRSWTVTSRDLEEVKAETIERAWSYMESQVEGGSVSVEISGNTHQFGTDRETRDNLVAVNSAISRGIPVDNPRYWTPKSSPTPIQVTHDDLATIGGAVMNKKDSMIQTYMFHKNMIAAQNSANSAYYYDFTTGYES